MYVYIYIYRPLARHRTNLIQRHSERKPTWPQRRCRKLQETPWRPQQGLETTFRASMSLGRRRGALRRRFREVPGRLLGPPGTSLGPFWGAPGASWRSFWQLFGPPRTQLELKWRKYGFCYTSQAKTCFFEVRGIENPSEVAPQRSLGSSVELARVAPSVFEGVAARKVPPKGSATQPNSPEPK